MSEKQVQKLLPAYLVVGEDALKRRTVLERLRKRIAELGDFEFNHDEFDAENADGSQIAIACNTLPFASELRLVEVFNIEKLKKLTCSLHTSQLQIKVPCSHCQARSSQRTRASTRRSPMWVRLQ